jgi:hypothetical protein
MSDSIKVEDTDTFFERVSPEYERANIAAVAASRAAKMASNIANHPNATKAEVIAAYEAHKLADVAHAKAGLLSNTPYHTHGHSSWEHVVAADAYYNKATHYMKG